MPDRWRFEAIGVPWEIVADELDAPVRARVSAQIERFDRVWSRFRTDSAVAQVAAAEHGSLRIPDDPGLVDLYRGLYAASGGRVSPLVGDCLVRLGYDGTVSLRPSGAPSAALPWDGTDVFPAGAVVDVGAIGKGFLVDLVVGVLGDAGVREATVDASGDLRRVGPPIRVGLEHPDDPRLAVGVVELADAAICASSTRRRAWPGDDGATLHHVLDATTGRPVEAVVATWAIATTAAVADAAATALFLMPRPPFEVAWARITADGRFERSADFPGVVFS